MILFIGSHIDDIEMFAGGTLLKLKEHNKVHCVALSSCEKSIPKGFDKNVLKREFANSMKYAGASYQLEDFPVRKFPQYRQEILELFVKLNIIFKPETVFCINDSHQDHKTVGEECFRAFKYCNLINFWNPLNSTNDFNYAVSLNEKEVRGKLELISFYKSQNFRTEFNDTHLTKLKYNGNLIKKEYAEIFKIIRKYD